MCKVRGPGGSTESELFQLLAEKWGRNSPYDLIMLFNTPAPPRITKNPAEAGLFTEVRGVDRLQYVEEFLSLHAYHRPVAKAHPVFLCYFALLIGSPARSL